MVIFQFPSTAIMVSRASLQTGMVFGQASGGGIAYPAAKPNPQIKRGRRESGR
jgi:hypothetical protein